MLAKAAPFLARRALIGVLTAGLLAGSALASTAGAETLTVWWNKGFYPAEDEAFDQVVAEWEKATGNKVNLSYYSTGDIPAKIISAITTGQVPDIAYADLNDFAIVPQQAWKGALEDVSDVVKPVENKFTPTALKGANLYNDQEKKRSYYAVPLKQQALHNFIWKPMIEEAGYSEKDIPLDNWDKYWAFFGDAQKKLRAKRQRVFALGFPMSTVDSDNYYTFNQLALAYGARFVKPDGTLNLDDPKAKEGAIKAITFLTQAYADGLVPQGAINWGDPDNNAAFFSKQIIMTSNASVSIPVSKSDDEKTYHEIITQPQPTGPDGQPVSSLVAVKIAVIPKGAPQVKLAKDFLSFLIEPERLDSYLRAARGRWLPVMPELIKSDPFWTDPTNPHIPVAVKQELEGPTEPWPFVYNPAYSQVNAEQVWGKAIGDVITNGLTPEKATEKAFARIREIFAQYQIAQN
ncbi:carbohydrate ABC transporter substrate-binding protein, CUT1 family [Arboricoccus pini]|uniref:Carbohydrate ABC transporter substrate-binding protein, CUT1 family n=1 Tax=Arboricoccus pini TaxID=1963835 RepID=A0A212R6G5_9PROT|nr:ABC transporter substrate-binding protein [Arboricoccus pini]SNB67752.1 carbohydrate ABC transporter substrate-binding protein, CUT1 family [Arboricoccus pini]